MWIRFLCLGSAVICYSAEATAKEDTAEEGEIKTVEEGIAAALETNNAWRAQKTEEKSAEANLSQSRKLLWLPNVSASVGSNRNGADGYQTSDSLNGDPIRTRINSKSTQTSVGVSVTQNIFSGFSNYNRTNAAKCTKEAAHHKLKFEEVRLVLNVLNIFTSIWVGRQKNKALTQKEDNLKKTADSKNSSMEAGLGTPTEVAQANANYQKAIYERIQAETELVTAESEFEKLTGKKPARNIELPRLKFPLPETLDKLIEQAKVANHSILAAKQEEQAERYNLNAAKGALLPSCDLSMDASKSLNKQKYNDHRHTYSASVRVTFPIYSNSPSSGNAFSAIELANLRLHKASCTTKDVEKNVITECTTEWHKYRSVDASIEAGRSAVNFAALSAEGSSAEEIAGVKSSVEILVAENERLDARINLITSLKEKVMSEAKIYALMGKLEYKNVVHSK
ncbi:MAG: TolC family protein [Holosporaceae bacterium]|nr:TolC family protein [Holosporaceae bacterium]